MLIRNAAARGAIWAVFGLLVLGLMASPVLITLMLALARQWTSFLPSGVTGEHLGEALSADSLASFSVSVQTAVISSALAVLLGTWAALAGRSAPAWLRQPMSALFHLPSAIPSVVIGLGVLIAFSTPPLLLNGTPAIVVAVQTVMVLAFTYSNVHAALEGLDRQQALVASSLGASPARILLTVTLPQLLPSIGAAAGLSLALCMGELGATMMVYPASWRTVPVSIFTALDRGEVFLAAAMTLLLLLITLVILALLALVRTGRGPARRGGGRRRAGKEGVGLAA
ncbi:ABC transporter permease [Rothia halotolerans]|uniref:ABC transporter permease n=1 Tax=Rothia halotolerans TaxID=405770 RepID=UPI00101D371A|nr:ABC transporter permease subunit [Rothia halotolerans]